MELARAKQTLPRVIWRESSTSTNAELRELVQSSRAEEMPHGTVLVTTNQSAGRGRLGRGWEMPANTAVAMSMVVRGFGGSEDSGDEGGLTPGWLPLLAGSAVARALQPFFGAGMRVGVKWPNDVHVRDEDDAMAGRPGRKLCGILCEMLPPDRTSLTRETPAIVVGIGINLLMDEWDLPTERATSLLVAGADVGEALRLDDAAGQVLADTVITRVGEELLKLAQLAEDEPGAARAIVLRHSLTLGTEVRVHLPGGQIVDGRARTLAEDGSLVVDLPTGGELTVSAGDVEHLR